MTTQACGERRIFEKLALTAWSVTRGVEETQDSWQPNEESWPSGQKLVADPFLVLCCYGFSTTLCSFLLQLLPFLPTNFSILSSLPFIFSSLVASVSSCLLLPLLCVYVGLLLPSSSGPGSCVGWRVGWGGSRGIEYDHLYTERAAAVTCKHVALSVSSSLKVYARNALCHLGSWYWG